MDWPALTIVLGEGSCPHRVCLAVVYPPADDARVIVAGRVGLKAAMRRAACGNARSCLRQCEELLAAMPEGLKAAMRGAAGGNAIQSCSEAHGLLAGMGDASRHVTACCLSPL